MGATAAATAERPAAQTDGATLDDETLKSLIRDQPWAKSLRFTEGKKRRLQKDPGNAALLLSHSAEWEGVLAFNELTLGVEFKGTPPELAGFARPTPGEVFGEQHLIYVQHWLAKQWELSLDKGKVFDAVSAAARLNSFHPILAYLDSLTWDGTPRLDGWLTTYCGARADQYHRAVGSKWMISAVARARSPGCKVDTMLILEGPQGEKKSAAVEVLAGSAYYTDTTLDLRSKDGMLNLLGIWIYEWGELDGLTKYDASRVKNFLSSKVDHFRAPFDRLPGNHPRQCVFAGTVNPGGEGYLRDETGNRRFWPVQVERADLSALVRDRDQLWAEADVRYRNGDTWWLDSKEADMAREEQEARHTGDPWHDTLAGCVQDRTAPIFADELFRSLGLVDDKDRTRSHQTRVGQVMSHLGWKKEREKVGQRRYFYVPRHPRPTSDDPPSHVADDR